MGIAIHVSSTLSELYLVDLDTVFDDCTSEATESPACYVSSYTSTAARHNTTVASTLLQQAAPCKFVTKGFADLMMHLFRLPRVRDWDQQASDADPWGIARLVR